MTAWQPESSPTGAAMTALTQPAHTGDSYTHEDDYVRCLRCRFQAPAYGKQAARREYREHAARALRVDAWNDEHPVGIPVRVWPGTTEGRHLDTVTRTPAWMLGDHTPAVSVADYAGGIALTHVQILEPSAQPGVSTPGGA